MARQNPALQVFNRGRISKLALARTDLDRTRLSAEVQINFMPRTLGSMMLRPGMEYIGGIRNNLKPVLIPFVFASTDKALRELTSTAMRVWVNDVVITRAGSTSVFANGSFTTNVLNWTDADESGSTSEWVAGGYLGLSGTRFARAIKRQTVVSSSGTHGVKIVIKRGRVTLRIGSSAGGDDYFAEATLRPGSYSFGIISTGNFDVEFSANTQYRSLVDSIAIESSGDMVVDSTWAGEDLTRLRSSTSADVTFVACSSYQQKRIERYDTESWGIANYEPEDGPFRSPNVTKKRLTASAITGDITLTCDKPLFKSGHVGGLFRLTSVGQDVTVTPSGVDQNSEPIRVSGVGDAREFKVLIVSSTGFDATVRVQRSVGEVGSWSDVTGLSFTSTVDTSHNDGLDNQIIFYRIGTGSTYVSGSPVSNLIYSAGGLAGVVRINAVSASTESSASVLSDLGSTEATETWEEGDWSAVRGFPSAVVIHEGRLYWFGKGKVWGSLPDAYESFDPDQEGDAGVINRSIGSGPVDRIEWAVSLGRLILGTQGDEQQAKTGALEEPLTPTNFNLRGVSNQGSANVAAVKIDKRALWIQQGGVRVMETAYDGGQVDYETAERSVLVPEIGEPSIARTAVQRQPDTRFHCVRGATDGTVAVLVSDPAENVTAWIDIETGDADGVNGVIEEVAVLPDSVEDAVYYVVKREINGSTVRYLEKWAKESQARGGSSNRMADSFVVQNSAATTLISGLDHLVGETVIAWGATADLGTYTVSDTGTITISTDSTTTCVGLPYWGTYISAKLAYAAQIGSALTQKKRINHLGLVMADVHAQGLRYGPSTDNLDPLPLVKLGSTISTDEVNEVFDHASFEFPGRWDTDSRLALHAAAPRPVTVLAAVISIETKEKT